MDQDFAERENDKTRVLGASASVGATGGNSSGDFPQAGEPAPSDVQSCLELLDRVWGAPPGAACSSLPEAAPVRSLGRFMVERKLGQGGFGIVFLAYDPQLDRKVALKVPHAAALLSPNLRQRFFNECRAAAQLEHPNIVPVHETGEIGSLCYMVSAYCEGPTLAAWLKDRTEPVPPRAAATLIARLADAVVYTHSRGVLHRDLKPANILLVSGGVVSGDWSGARGEESGAGSQEPEPLTTHHLRLTDYQPKITDFGLAKLLEHSEGETGSGVLMGTARYMSPEQAGGWHGEIGPGSDIFALGVILYELLAGRPPFLGDSDLETLRQIREAEPPTLVHGRPNIPRDLEAICRKCLEKSPPQRYSGAGALAEDLRRFLRGEPVQARRAHFVARGRMWCRRHPAGAGLVMVSALALLGFGLGGLEYGRRQQHHSLELQEAFTREEKQRVLVQERELLARRRLYGLELKAAGEALASGKPVVTLDLLANQRSGTEQEDLRDFTWYYLRQQCRPLRAVLRGQFAGPTTVAFGPDGRTLASGSTDGTVCRWEIDTGKLTAKVKRPGMWVHSLSFTPEGALWIEDGDLQSRELCRWDPATGNLQVRWTGSGSTVRLAFSADLRQMGLALKDELRIWDFERNAELASVKEPDIYSLHFTPDNQQLIGIGRSGTSGIRVWDSHGRYCQRFSYVGQVLSSALSPNGRLLALGLRGDMIALYTLFPPSLVVQVHAHDTEIWNLAFAPDSRMLASGCNRPSLSNNKTSPPAVKLWEVPTMRLLAEFDGDCGALAFSTDGRLLAHASEIYRTVRLYDVGWAPPIAAWTGHNAEAWALAYSPDGRTLVSAGDDHLIKLWDAATGKPKGSLRGHDALVTSLAFTPDGQMLASGSFDKQVIVWNMTTATPRANLKGHAKEIYSITLTPDGRALVTAGKGGPVKTWDLVTGNECWSVVDQLILAGGVAVAPDGKTLAVTRDEDVSCWDISTRQLRWTGATGQVLRMATFSPDSKTVATIGDGGMIRLWDTATGEVRRDLVGHGASILTVAFSPDGKTLATAGLDKVVRLWDPASGVELLSLKGHTAQINSVVFSPDGQTLASADHAGQIRLWHAPR
jgi:WD40 repeat protein